MKVASAIPTEHSEQCVLIRWFDLSFPELRGRLAAVPNASKVPAYVGKKMNLEGRRKGYPDLQLLTPRHGFHGLIIELKRIKGGTLQAEQSEWLDWLGSQGYMAVVCKGADAAMDTIKNYLR